jgi:hypothetical protein
MAWVNIKRIYKHTTIWEELQVRNDKTRISGVGALNPITQHNGCSSGHAWRSLSIRNTLVETLYIWLCILFITLIFNTISSIFYYSLFIIFVLFQHLTLWVCWLLRIVFCIIFVLCDIHIIYIYIYCIYLFIYVWPHWLI